MTGRRWTRAAAAALVGAVLMLSGCTAPTQVIPTPTPDPPRALSGTLDPLASGVSRSAWTVTAWNTGPDGSRAIGTGTTDATGGFDLEIDETDVEGVVYVDARPKDAERALLGVIVDPAATSVTLNERTTVAAGFGLAPFFGQAVPTGREKAVTNAASMAANLADPATGALGTVLSTSPNGAETPTLATFTSLTRMLSACLQTAKSCDSLFTAAGNDRDRLASASAAFAGIARDPSGSADQLFALSLTARNLDPGLAEPPTAWTLALRFTGAEQGDDALVGPGTFAIDPDGHIFVTDSYPVDETGSALCGARVVEFAPDGSRVSALPGGQTGLGIDFDRTGRLWVSAAGACADTADSTDGAVALFDGPTQVSPETGYTRGRLSSPQGLEVDRDGNLWIANCGNDTISRYTAADPGEAKNLGSVGLRTPFGIVDNGQSVFVTGSGDDSVAVLGRDGEPLDSSPLSEGFDQPLGITSDRAGNVWVANAAGGVPACADSTPGPRGLPSIMLISPNGTTVSVPFTGGGITVPRAIATDGDGNVWVANASGQRISEFCGADAATCPRDLVTGEPISPDGTGYTFEGFTGSTGVAVDPSGNVWVTDNAPADPAQPGSGGRHIVAFVGAAAPVAVDEFQ